MKMKKCLSMILAFMMIATLFTFPIESSIAAVDEGKAKTVEPESALGGGTELTALSESDVELDKTEYTYTSEEIVPQVTVKHAEALLVQDQDYIVELSDNINVGKATVTVTGIGAYTGTVTRQFDIKGVTSSMVTVDAGAVDRDYTGAAIRPEVTVMYNGAPVDKKDYTVTYSNNVYPGTATIHIEGRNGFSDVSIDKKFYIARVTSLVRTGTRTSSDLTLKWQYKGNVTGYMVYQRDSAGRYMWIKTIKGSRNTSTKLTGLSAGKTYAYSVRAYVKNNGKTYNGVTRRLTTFTRPGKVQIGLVSALPDLSLHINWKKRYSSGYLIKLSRYSDFRKSTTYNVTSPGIAYKKLTKMADDKYYYVKVKAYKKVGSSISYGYWSNTKKVKTYNTGWITTGGKKRYIQNGKTLYGYHKVNGNPCYFDPYTGEWRGASPVMWNKVKNSYSNTKYLIAVTGGANRFCLYTGKKGEWKLDKYWKCSTGAKGATRTPKGSWLIKPSTSTTSTYVRNFGEKKGYTCWYGTRFFKQCLIHSVIYAPFSKTTILDARLGMNVSHGCIRLPINQAKWVYDNIKPGTRVIVY